MRPMPELRVETMRVDELVPYAHNAKEHPREQVEQIARSIEEFGDCDPIAVWHNADGSPEIVEGHGRVLALKRLGVKEAPVICLDHLTDSQRRMYSHVHNQTTLSSGWDEAALMADLDELSDEFDAAGFGFDGEMAGDFDVEEPGGIEDQGGGAVRLQATFPDRKSMESVRAEVEEAVAAAGGRVSVAMA